MKLSLTILLCVAACAAAVGHAQEIVVGLITKTDTNPFFVKMKEGAMEAAKAKGARLMTRPESSTATMPPRSPPSRTW